MDNFNEKSILYTVCAKLFRENSGPGYETISQYICSALGLYCCSIWRKENNGQQRLGYHERGGSTLDLTISNLDFQVNKYIYEQKMPVVIEESKTDKRFSDVRSFPVNVLGMPIVNGNSVLGSLTFYYGNGVSEELLDIQQSIANELAVGIDQLKQNYFSTVRLQKLRRELESARNIQQSLLPKQFPKVPGIQIGARTISTYEVSGDYYDFVNTDHENLGIVLGDVMGKGVPAAMLMAMARTVTRSVAKHDLAPNVVLSEINSALYDDLAPAGMFLTMIYTLYNPQQKALLYSSAGHNPPVILGKKSGKIEFLHCRGVYIGGRAKLTYKLQTKKLESGDIVVFYTDGLLDAKNSQGEEFGIERVAAVLKEYEHCEVPAIVDFLGMKVMQFVGTTEQVDDITYVLIKAE